MTILVLFPLSSLLSSFLGHTFLNSMHLVNSLCRARVNMERSSLERQHGAVSSVQGTKLLAILSHESGPAARDRELAEIGNECLAECHGTRATVHGEKILVNLKQKTALVRGEEATRVTREAMEDIEVHLEGLQVEDGNNNGYSRPSSQRSSSDILLGAFKRGAEKGETQAEKERKHPSVCVLASVSGEIRCAESERVCGNSFGVSSHAAGVCWKDLHRKISYVEQTSLEESDPMSTQHFSAGCVPHLSMPSSNQDLRGTVLCAQNPSVEGSSVKSSSAEVVHVLIDAAIETPREQLSSHMSSNHLGSSSVFPLGDDRHLRACKITTGTLSGSSFGSPVQTNDVLPKVAGGPPQRRRMSSGLQFTSFAASDEGARIEFLDLDKRHDPDGKREIFLPTYVRSHASLVHRTWIAKKLGGKVCVRTYVYERVFGKDKIWSSAGIGTVNFLSSRPFFQCKCQYVRRGASLRSAPGSQGPSHEGCRVFASQ